MGKFGNERKSEVVVVASAMNGSAWFVLAILECRNMVLTTPLN